MPIVCLKRRALHVSLTNLVNIYGKTTKLYLHFQSYLNTEVALLVKSLVADKAPFIRLSGKVIAADGVAAQGVKTSAAIVLAYFSSKILVSAQEWKHMKVRIKWTTIGRRHFKCIFMETIVLWLQIHWSLFLGASLKRNQCWLINCLVPNLVWIGGDPVHWHIFAPQASMYYMIIWPPNVWRFNRYKI